MIIKYIGKNGQYLLGIPARNLTEEDWESLTKEQRKEALASGIYVKPDADDKPDHKKATATKDESTDKPHG